MQSKALTLAALFGMTGCAIPNDAGICAAISPHVAELRTALLAHPETPDDVGEAGADVVIGIEAGCG